MFGLACRLMLSAYASELEPQVTIGVDTKRGRARGSVRGRVVETAEVAGKEEMDEVKGEEAVLVAMPEIREGAILFNFLGVNNA